MIIKKCVSERLIEVGGDHLSKVVYLQPCNARKRALILAQHADTAGPDEWVNPSVAGFHGHESVPPDVLYQYAAELFAAACEVDMEHAEIVFGKPNTPHIVIAN